MKPCQKCGVSKPFEMFSKCSSRTDGLQKWCKDCWSEYRAANRERASELQKTTYFKKRDIILEAARLRYESKRDEILEYQRSYYESNRGKIFARKKRYCEENREKVLERGKKYYAENRNKHAEYKRVNRERIRDRERQYRRENPEVGTRKNHARRSRKLGLPYETVSVRAIAVRDGAWCWMCGSELSDWDPAHLDHLIPVSADSWDLDPWGLNNPGTVLANMSLACPACNLKKSSKILPCAILRFIRNLNFATTE